MFIWKNPRSVRAADGASRALIIVVLALASSVSAESIDPARLRRHVETLASDEFEGRAPGTAGETKTVEYLAEAFRSAGAQPGNPDGSYFQEAHLVGITSEVQTVIAAGGRTFSPEPINDYSAISRRLLEQDQVTDSEIVFVGYGVVAPEYGWDDYKGVDVRGKTLVMLINDPPVTHPSGKLDDEVFRGRAMTYYGRWTYKYEIAAEKGAAACLIIHETGPAGYPFAVVGSNAGREHFDLKTVTGKRERTAVEAWMTWEFSKQLFEAAGQDLTALKASAAKRDFKPVTLKAKASFTVKNAIRDVRSRNVLATVPGRDPALRDEYVIFSSHWDHLGRDERMTGDNIFNGATDNASGTAVLLELARAFATLPGEQRPARSLLFLAVTAEEMGLLGSRYYAQNPLYPLERTIANINIDGANHFAATKDVEVIGSGATTIEDIAHQVASDQGRVVTADTQPEKGFFYRSDHFEFAKVGVPAFYGKAGRQPIDKPADYIDRKRSAYIANDYHKVSDELREDWDFSAMVQEADFLFALGRRVADSTVAPEWRAGNEFKARRDLMLRDTSK